MCIKCSQLRHTALHPLAMASLRHRDVSELLSAEIVRNLGIVGSVRVFAVSSRWNELIDAGWDAVQVLRLTDSASTHVKCNDDQGICVADCTLLHWSRLPETQKLRLARDVQSLILYLRTPGSIIGPTLWQPEYAEHFSSLNFLALIHVRASGGPLVNSFGKHGTLSYDGRGFSLCYIDEAQQFSDAFIPASVRQLYLHCDLLSSPSDRQDSFPLYGRHGRNIHCVAVRNLVPISVEESNHYHFAQVSALANLDTLDLEAEVVAFLRVVKWCPRLQRLGFAVCDGSWSRIRDANYAGSLGHITVLVLGFESMKSLLVEHIVEAIPRSVQLLFLRVDLTAHTAYGDADHFLIELQTELHRNSHHAGMWVFLQDTYRVQYTHPWSWWEGPHVDMFSPFMERSLWSNPMQLKDAMGLHKMIHMDMVV